MQQKFNNMKSDFELKKEAFLNAQKAHLQNLIFVPFISNY
jgi:hypothetical protein